MPTVVVEIHVPLLPTPGLPDGSYPFPWIEEVEDFLSVLEDQGDVEVFDEGEEDGDVYVFFVSRAGEGIFWRWRPAWPRCLGFLREPLRSSATTRPRSSVWDDGWRFRCPRPEH
ncbi:hypothetical protein ACWDFR_45115 [Streptomyces sp. 900105755]